MEFSVKDFMFFKRPGWSFGGFSPIYIKEMQEITNFLEICKSVEVCNVFLNWDLFVIKFY